MAIDERDKVLRNLSGSLISGSTRLSGGNKADTILNQMGASSLNLTPPSGGVPVSSSPLVEAKKAAMEEMPQYKEHVLTDYIYDGDGNSMTREDLEAKYQLSEESKAIFNANLNYEDLQAKGLVAIQDADGNFLNIDPDNRIEIKDVNGNVVATRVGFSDSRTYWTKENKRNLLDNQIRRIHASKGIPTDHTEAFIARSNELELMGHTNITREKYRRNLKVDTLFSNELSSLGDLKSGLGPYLAGTRNDSRSVSAISNEIMKADSSITYANPTGIKIGGGLITQGIKPRSPDGDTFAYNDIKNMKITIEDTTAYLFGSDETRLADNFYLAENRGDIEEKWGEEIKNASARHRVIIDDAAKEEYRGRLKYVTNNDGDEFSGSNLSNGNVLALYLSKTIGPDLTDPYNKLKVNEFMAETGLIDLGPKGTAYNTFTSEERKKFDALNMAYFTSVVKPALDARIDGMVNTFGEQSKNLIMQSWDARRKGGGVYASLLAQREAVQSDLTSNSYGRNLLAQANNINIFAEKTIIGDNGQPVNVPVAANFTLDRAIGRLAHTTSQAEKSEIIREWHDYGYITDEGMGWFYNVINFQAQHTKGLNDNIQALELVLDIKAGGTKKSSTFTGDPGDISTFGQSLDSRMLAGKVEWNGKSFDPRTDNFSTDGILPTTTANLIDKLNGIYNSPRADFEGRPDVESYIQGVILTKTPAEIKAAYPKRLANFSEEDIFRAIDDMKGWSKQDFRDQVFELSRLKTVPVRIPETGIVKPKDQPIKLKEKAAFPINIFTPSLKAQQYEAETGERYIDRPTDEYSGERYESDETYDFITMREQNLKPGTLFSNDGMLLVLPGNPNYDKARRQAKTRGQQIIRIRNREYAISPEDIDSDEGVSLGKPTGGTTTGAIEGKQVYRYKGENVSEKSTTFKYKGKWINIPSIHDGKQYTDEQLTKMLDENLIKPTSIHEDKDEAEKAAEERSNQTRIR